MKNLCIIVNIVKNNEQLILVHKSQKNKLSRAILNTASQEYINRVILIQEKIGGTEFGMDILNDFNGTYYGFFVREKISMKSGKTDEAIPIMKFLILEKRF